jgi:serine/threonine-protein kinase
MLDLPASFGKYFLTDKIATGGMAEIYLAKLIGPGGFEKQLVIKQIHPELGGKPAFVDLFVAEAKTLVSLSHGNIVPIYELGLIEDRYFIAMEYIDGPTLDRLQRALDACDAAMEPAMAVYVIAEILKGLDYAHRKGDGVIHRDLSPRNVMLSREGEVKLVDFGIAVPLGHEREGDGNVPVGSFPYMSPEQVRGQRLTGQSDVFSAGVLLWEMLVGQPLFARASAEDTLAAVTDAPIAPPSARRTDVPPALDAICLRALARDPTERYPSAAAYLADVHRHLYSLAEPVAPVAVSRLVARLCPPTVQRAAIDDRVALAATEPHDGAGAAGLAGSDGTRPWPRSAQARGKRRAATEQSFATHVEIERVLSGTAPMPRPDSVAGARGKDTPAAAQAAVSDPVDGGADQAATASAGTAQVRPDARRTSRLGPAAALALLAGAASIALLGQTSEPDEPREPSQTSQTGQTSEPTGPRQTADTREAAGTHVTAPRIEAGPGAPAGPPVAAGSLSASGAAERPALAGATPLPPADASVLPASTPGAGAPAPGQRIGAPASERARHPSGKPRPAPARPGPTPSGTGAGAGKDGAATGAAAGTGTLKVGANPWGEVYLDGHKLGRAPNAWPIAAGAHVVEVVFPVGDPPPRRRFAVDVAPGETESLGVVDFSDAASPNP